MAGFRLVDSPFVPCIIAGEVAHLGLRQTLIRAAEITELRDSSPLVTIALHRLLLAILHSALKGPDGPDQWKQWWSRGAFDQAPIDAYFKQVVDRFDIFDANHPFFQDGAITAKARNGINQLVRELSRGNNATLFDHTHEEPPPRLEAPAVARALIAEQLFAVGGGKSELGYTSSAPAAGGVIILVRGRNLFETLLLNMLPPEVAGFAGDASKDKPAWERTKRPTEERKSPDGYLDYLTWQSRSICLQPESDGTVQFMSYAAGRTYDPDGPGYEPMTPYTLDASNPAAEARAVRFAEGKDLWRDSAALFQFDNAKEFRPPRNLAWLRELREEGCLSSDRAFALSAFGLCTDKAKVNFWRHESLPLPLEYLADKDLVYALKSAIQVAEDVGEQVRFAAAAMARLALTADPQKSADKNRQWQMVDAIGADALYWSRLEREFRTLLVNLPGSVEHQQEQLRNWFQILRRTALDSYRDAAQWPQLHERERRGAVEGEAQLLRNLGRIGKAFRSPQPTTTGATA